MLQNDYRFTLQEFSGSLKTDSMFVTAFIGILSLVTNIAVGFAAGLVLVFVLDRVVYLRRGVAS